MEGGRKPSSDQLEKSTLPVSGSRIPVADPVAASRDRDTLSPEEIAEELRRAYGPDFLEAHPLTGPVPSEPVSVPPLSIPPLPPISSSSTAGQPAVPHLRLIPGDAPVPRAPRGGGDELSVVRLKAAEAVQETVRVLSFEDAFQTMPPRVKSQLIQLTQLAGNPYEFIQLFDTYCDDHLFLDGLVRLLDGRIVRWKTAPSNPLEDWAVQSCSSALLKEGKNPDVTLRKYAPGSTPSSLIPRTVAPLSKILSVNIGLILQQVAQKK